MEIKDYCHFYECDVHTAKVLRDMDDKADWDAKMAACKARDAVWRAERDAKRAALQSVTNPIARWVRGMLI